MDRKATVTQAFVLLFSGYLASVAQEGSICSCLEVTAGYTILAGSFNGTEYFQTDEDIMLVPRIKPAPGIGGIIGFGTERFIVDFGYHYARSEYSTMDDGYSGSSSTHLIRFLGVKKYLNSYAERKISPYIDFDLTLAYNRFKKIAYPIGNISDPSGGRYAGIIFGVGGGVRIRLMENLSLDIRILPEYYIGTDIRVKGRDWYAITKFDNFLLHNTLGLRYQFGAKNNS